jgi:hypothetical protein
MFTDSDVDMARVSIIDPTNFKNKDRIATIIAEFKKEIKEVYIYDCPMGLIIFDKYVEPLEVKKFYKEIIDYKQAIGEKLSDIEMIIREEEVYYKWMDGNFSYWILET